MSDRAKQPPRPARHTDITPPDPGDIADTAETDDAVTPLPRDDELSDAENPSEPRRPR